MAGYLHLFYDDSDISSPTLNLLSTKNDIWNKYKTSLLKPNAEDKTTLIQFVQNLTLKKIESELQIITTQAQSQNVAIPYWGINIEEAKTRIANLTSEVEKIDEMIKYLGEIQEICSMTIERGQGIISSDIIEQLRDNIESLKSIGKNLGVTVAEKTFDTTFYGVLRGAINRAQGAVHEAVMAIAGVSAEQKINQELVHLNQDIKVIIEQTGGHLKEDSRIKTMAQQNNLNLGNSNNAKNDITIAVTDGNGTVLWHTGLSLKSTASATPSKVHIMDISVGTLLHRIYDQNTYLHLAAGLGIGDWTDTQTEIAALARQQNIKTAGADLSKQWKDIIYDALFDQIINIFTGIGSGGILNNAQYILLNNTVISMYDIFQKLETMQKSRLYSITGIGFNNIGKSINRQRYTNENISAFQKSIDEDPSNTGERNRRSAAAWTNVQSILQDTKINIQLKYADIFKLASPTR